LINRNENQVDLEFGTGDICVNSGFYLDDDNKKIGIIAFSNQSQREIGIEGDIKAGQECKVGDFPVIMTFIKKESIDVVINALIDAKKQMD
jgi:hypothetical protein